MLRSGKFVPIKKKLHVAYYRVSTSKQGEGGNGIQAQKDAVSRLLSSINPPAELIQEFTEVESGGDNNRPKLLEALALCKKTSATLVISKLDRLSRNAAFLLGLQDSKTPFVCCDYPSANELTIGLLAVIAQEERRMISARTKAALAVVKARGVKLGNPRPEVAIAAMRAANTANKVKRAQAVYKAIRQCRGTGVKTLKGLAECLELRGYKTPRGGTTWTETAVRRVLLVMEPAA
jgi:DNA invertase Pin-like site-specific DNA recombinase